LDRPCRRRTSNWRRRPRQEPFPCRCEPAVHASQGHHRLDRYVADAALDRSRRTIRDSLRPFSSARSICFR
jgi:hypothetical protein